MSCAGRQNPNVNSCDHPKIMKKKKNPTVFEDLLDVHFFFINVSSIKNILYKHPKHVNLISKIAYI